MSGLVLILHVIVAVFLILIVLLQSGKGASIGATFGGSSQTLFGSRGPASFLSKLTTASAVIFMLTSLALSMMSSAGSRQSIADEISSPAPQQAPASSTVDPFEGMGGEQAPLPETPATGETGAKE